MQNMTKKNVIIYSVVITLVIYGIAYVLSSRETLFDFKNIVLIFLFSYIWMFIYNRCRRNFIVIFHFIALLLGFSVPAMAFPSEPMFLQRLMKDFLFYYSLPLIPIAIMQTISVFGSYKRVKYAISAIVLIVAIAPLLLLSIYYIIFGVPMSVDSLLAILQSNKQESLEFIATYATPTVIAFCLTFVILTISGIRYILAKFVDEIPPLFDKRIYVFLLAFLVLSANFDFAHKTYFVRTIQQALNQYAGITDFTADSHMRTKRLAANPSISEASINANFALIIGETHARSNMSAYGYKRETTPWLHKAVLAGDVVLLKNSFSNAAVTSSSLAYALTAKNQYNDMTAKDAITITEIAQASGFNVVWISNQVDDNIAGLIGHEADQQHWLNNKHNDTWLRQKNNLFDDKIIKCLSAMDKPSTKTLYVINLLGSHASYNCRYPEEFNKWDDANDNLINAYDNSVLYNDYVMSKICSLLFDKFKVDALMYFSDHGEELQLKFCHGTEYFYNNYKKYPSVREIVKIPTYFAFSPQYIKLNPDILVNLQSNQDKYYTNDMAYDTMLGLMHIPAPYYDSRYDITSADYAMTLKELKTNHGKVNLEDCL